MNTPLEMRDAQAEGCRRSKDRSLSLSLGTNKILAQHYERLAVVYVRQSTPQQVLDHRESAELQYKLADRAVELGWPRDRVLVIDDDQARTASTIEGRLGFQRLLAEVSLNHVGIVLGMEMNRLARSNKDWHQLLELCAMFDTLLYDHDGLYDASHYNDRLVLGLKGTMSEAELHILNTRMHQGRRNKAERGELFTGKTACGYVRLPSGEVAKDPDEQAQGVISLVFQKFSELKSGHGLLRYLVRENICLPFRVRNGVDFGRLDWRRPNLTRLLDMLRHPLYAGAYVYGRRPVDPKRKKPGKSSSGQKLVSMEQWQVLMTDRLPAYITWPQFLQNQQTLAANRTQTQSQGPPREGSSLLSGLIVCGRCGRHMQVRYTGPFPYYYCSGQIAYGIGSLCQSISGRVLDELVAEQTLKALQPASLELSLKAAKDVEKERKALHQHWRRRLERSQYETERARRQFDAVEPENRLVARELERQWESALIEDRKLEEEYDRFRNELPVELSNDQRSSIMSLASDIPALWHAPSTTNTDRQCVVRHVVEQVVVEVVGQSEVASFTIHWKGGYQSEHEVIRPVSSYTQMQYFEQLKERVKKLNLQGYTAANIAEQLNKDGLRTPHQLLHTAASVRQFIYRFNLVGETARLLENEWWISDLAKELDVPWPTMNGWRNKGWLHARRVEGTRRAFWIAWADREELDRLKRLRDNQRHGQAHPVELTNPKPKPKR